MKYCIDTEILKKNNLDLSEFLLLWLSSYNKKVSEIKDSLVEKNLLHPEFIKSELLPVLDIDLKNEISGMIIDSSSKENGVKRSDTFYEELAEKMREFFPKGKKEGTSYMWRDSKATIARRLKLLNIKYGYEYTEEQALKATEAYVKSFNGDYRFMQLLKYFILKVPINANGDVEVRSEFMSYIENEGQEDINNAWLNELK
jgi:hypothetical protein